MKKPIIGVTPLYDGKLHSFWMLEEYFNAIQWAGGIPVVIGFTDNKEDFPQIVERFDGFVFTGGQDFDPLLYGQEKKETCGEFAPKRDKLEIGLLPEIMKADLPIFGICRGMQLLNVLCGGTLYQDLPTDFSDSVNHDREKPNDAFHHKVVVDTETYPGELLGKEIIDVNSLHHQGVDMIGDDLVPFAFSEEDGLIEGFYHNKKSWVIGLQWHPELIFPKEEGNQRIWKDFIRAAKEKMKE
ncbi:MAG: gamma-glutamyl-gamma-aminobutyrate hydrolase family protein [Tissierellia bacterium]|nr:gamma-glutamyl-gamma-aminobutyrate hydrolase family protein [Tissierellia bacterium]